MKDTAILPAAAWCMVKPFDSLPGILSVVSGFTGGHVPHPTYQEVTTGTTGHTEAAEITFDPEQITYEELVAIYGNKPILQMPLVSCADREGLLPSVIYYNSEEQRKIAEASKAALQAKRSLYRSIVTTIEPAEPFYPAEDYHQDFYKEKYGALQRLP